MTRLLYGLVLLLALPWVWGRLLWKARLDPAYGRRIGERFGGSPAELAGGVIWFHTVSAGETIAAAPVIRAVRERLPEAKLLVTTMTPTGSARAAALLGDIAQHCYAPYDYPWAVARFLRRTRPKALVLMETELWPNLIERTAAAGAKVLLVNARLSERSYRGYRRVAPLARRMLRRIDRVVCQYEDTAQRFRELGAEAVEVTGSVKFDAELPPDRFGVGDGGLGGASAWIAGSTHAGEEDVVLDAHRRLLRRYPDLRLILAPRHPERAAAVARLAQDRGLRAGRLSARASDVQVLVGDVMGTLAHLYGLAAVAFVGGSLNRTGGHNPIEPAMHGVPVLMGPARFNFEEICSRFAAAGCLHPVADAADIVDLVGERLDDPALRRREGKRAQAVVAANRGAQQALVDKLCRWLG